MRIDAFISFGLQAKLPLQRRIGPILRGSVGDIFNLAYAPAERIDFLYFVHDRHAGNKAASRDYLVWELGLLAQLDHEERGAFRPLTSE